MALTKFWRKLGLRHTVSNSLTHGESTQCFMCRCSSSGGRAQCSRFLVRWNLRTQTNLNTSTWRKFFGGGGVQRPVGDNASFWSYGRGIPWRMQSGSPHRISVIKMHSRKTFRPTGFPKNSEADLVSVDRNSSMGGSSCGKSGSFPWGCHGHWLA